MTQKSPKTRAYYGNRSASVSTPSRVRLLQAAFFLVAAMLIVRLGYLQILKHGVYEALASGQRELYKDLYPQRGSILVEDRDGTEVAIATNQFLNLVWAEPRKVDDPVRTADVLSDILGLSREGEESVNDQGETITLPSEYDHVLAQLQKADDPYEPIKRRVSEELGDEITRANLTGIHLLREQFRFYPEEETTAHVTGFVSEDPNGTVSGKYGLEGYFNDTLAGQPGFLFSELDAKGNWIGIGARNLHDAQNGADLVLTLDRTIQHVACTKLQENVDRFEADSGSLIILDSKTGAVWAMCGVPTYNPNVYNEVESISVYNNQAIFSAYEPGSVFKPLVMAAGLDAGAVTPSMTYNDTGEEKIDRYTIRNSDHKANGIQTMTEVLEKSLNTGMIFVMRKMGGDVLARYVHDFGFGETIGISLNSEVQGEISAVDKGHEIYSATSSYGQGLTVTPLQMARAYTALANGGAMMQPYLVKEVRHQDGTVEKTDPVQLRQVVSPKTAQLTTAMLVSTVENGHAGLAKVDGYYIAGKTGTAQVANDSGTGYQTGNTIATFVGYGPARDPRFVMLIRIDHPRASEWAAGTAAPLFGEIADFLLHYKQISPER
ncbi:hypothetical protein COV06_01190 [Candidatus Uhrbacteria bacterium CG10_big_fil_rev_8_21_14_0_10_50_16]|uniref:Penicillin-binding protein 2 n=1 Tax=Candidatus Uhrbacteria bacterium CG10_big_fil_rev_8_21_14_0_10_50_16 TaxID=1975039 RepID=A0A2H0RNH5_9BACT|nr:MAG: hypothetical protein COV06_01190 [Candidatus Uhrbacteria bacterium CG10_big_fil_rev_8_21_14_0_10_50_16]